MLNALAPAVTAAQAASPLDSPPHGELCSADDGKALPPAAPHEGHGGHGSCPFCVPHAGSFLIAGSAAGWSLPPAQIVRAVPSAAIGLPTAIHAFAFHPRGPPAAA